MSVSAKPQLSEFALDVLDGLSQKQKKLSPRYFYDDLGAVLFEAITLLPEYGLTRADERLIALHAPQIAREIGAVSAIAELGSGFGKKTRHILGNFYESTGKPIYRPIDVSSASLAACERDLANLSNVQPICGDWMEGLAKAVSSRHHDAPLLLLFLGSSIGNLEREETVTFLRQLRSCLRPSDFFLLGADLVKSIEVMVAAYDDPTGVTAAFNLNVLGRINRELGADFDLRLFAHQIRWNSGARRIEMHLRCVRNQTVYVSALETAFDFDADETIWTESSHKFTEAELDTYARMSGFLPVHVWVDQEWPFAEALWRAI